MSVTTELMAGHLEAEVQRLINDLPAGDWAAAVDKLDDEGKLDYAYGLGASIGYTRRQIRERLILGTRTVVTTKTGWKIEVLPERSSVTVYGNDGTTVEALFTIDRPAAAELGALLTKITNR